MTVKYHPRAGSWGHPCSLAAAVGRWALLPSGKLSRDVKVVCDVMCLECRLAEGLPTAGPVSELAFLIDRGHSRLEVVEERQD